MRHSSTPRAKRRRGVGLPTTLVVITIIVMLGFTVAGVSFSHLSVSTRLSNAEIARNRAESVVAMAIDRVITDREASNPDFNGQLSLPIPPSEPGGSGTVCFDPLQASALQIPFSTNNISADVSKIGDLSRVVPAHGIHVLGVGICNGVERRVEAILLIPKFPHSIASSGRITSNGGLTVASVDDLALLTSGGLASIPPDQIEPGDIACNSPNVAQAMRLYGPDIHITGDARAVGGIDWDSSTVVVDGMVRPNSDKSFLPKLNVTDYDPAGKPGLVSVSGNQSNLVVNNWTKSSGNLIVSGGLTLDAGVLYVEGDLSVNGGISGNGAVIVTGKTEVFGGGAQSTDNMAAVLSGQGLKLQATQADGAQFKGLLYTEGDLTADWVTLGGAAVANAPGAGSEVALNNVNVAYNQAATEITIPVGQNAGPPGPSGPTFPPPPPPWTGPTPATIPSYNPQNVGAPNVNVSFKPVMASAPPPSFFYTAGPPAQYAVPNGATLAPMMQWEVQVGGQPPQQVSYANMALEIKNQMQAELGPLWLASDGPNIDQYFFTGLPLPPPLTGPKWVDTYVNVTLQSAYEASLTSILDQATDYIATNAPPVTWGSAPPPPPPVVVDTLTISINDSTFADLRDKMKVLYWGAPW